MRAFAFSGRPLVRAFVVALAAAAVGGTWLVMGTATSAQATSTTLASRLALQDAPPAVRAALAPAFGAVALAVTTLITARAFGHLDGVGSAAAVSVALLGSMAAAVAGLRADRARAAVADA